jgi:hypothetical protein
MVPLGPTPTGQPVENSVYFRMRNGG